MDLHKDQSCRPQPVERPLCCRLEQSARAGGSTPLSPAQKQVDTYTKYQSTLTVSLHTPETTSATFILLFHKYYIVVLVGVKA